MDSRKALLIVVLLVGALFVTRVVRGSAFFARQQAAKLPWRYKFQVLPRFPQVGPWIVAINDNRGIIGSTPARLKVDGGSSLPEPAPWKIKDGYFQPTGINATGDVSGILSKQDSQNIHQQAVFYSKDNRISKITPDGTESAAMGISASSQIVGWFERERTDVPESSPKHTANIGNHAFLWQNSTLQDIDPDYKYGSQAVSINDQGQVVFFRFTGEVGRPGGKSLCCLWENGKITVLPEFSGSGGKPVKINNRSQILVMVQSKKPVIWDKGKVTKIGNLPGKNAWHAPRTGYGYDSDARDMNDEGEVVGTGASTKRLNMVGMPDDTGFLFSNGKLYDLDTFLPSGCEYCIEHAEGINNRGDIVGVAKNKKTNARCPFVLLRENK